MKPYSVIDVSNYFIDYYKRSVDLMTVPRVQLFVYFAQAESLCRFGRPLFLDEIRAYPNGPGCSRLYAYYEGAGNNPINVYKDFDISIFEEEDLQLLKDVAIYYNTYSTSQLQIMTYAVGGPWEQSYIQGTDLRAIEPSIIKEFYESKPRVPDYHSTMLQAISNACDICFMPNSKPASESTTINTMDEVTQSWE